MDYKNLPDQKAARKRIRERGELLVFAFWLIVILLGLVAVQAIMNVSECIK